MTLRFWKKDEPPLPPGDEPSDIGWQRDERGYYQRLLRLRPQSSGLDGVGGVYVMWHRGVHPKWIYVGATDDLAQAIGDARDSERVLSYEAYGCVYVTWALVRKEYQSGVVAYLRDTLAPEIDDVFPADRIAMDATPIPVLPPG
ncbi:MAG: hypothetical protein F8N37_02405 [Telmatospirillum sp.]|nr:hypothetical protein [Telmatospirillum sp.]